MPENIFDDLGLEDSVYLSMKASIASLIYDRIEHLKQKEAAKVLGISQQKISKLKVGRLDDFSVKKLLIFSRILCIDVKIEVSV